jgi:hypothetical protein
MVTERMNTKPKGRPRGIFSRLHKITGIQSNAANRKRAAAPRKGGTYSARVSAATQVVPQTMASAAKVQYFRPTAVLESIPVHRKRKGLRTARNPLRLLKPSDRLLRSAASATTGATARTTATTAMPPAPLACGTTWATAC